MTTTDNESKLEGGCIVTATERTAPGVLAQHERDCERCRFVAQHGVVHQGLCPVGTGLRAFVESRTEKGSRLYNHEILHIVGLLIEQPDIGSWERLLAIHAIVDEYMGGQA